jgi:hypothetical protein
LSYVDFLSVVSSDTVGYTDTSGESEFASYACAVESIKEVGGYINGWEYLAGDSADSLSTFAEPIDSIFREHCLLFRHSSHPAVRRLIDCMKWVFISSGVSGSSFHVDPICSAAWMLVLSGQKEWHVRDVSGDHVWVGRVSKGALIVIPSGFSHKVVNIPTNEPTIAVTHNWVPISSREDLAGAVDRSLREVRELMADGIGLEDIHGLGNFDSLMFGLLMIIIFHGDELGYLGLPIDRAVVDRIRELEE